MPEAECGIQTSIWFLNDRPASSRIFSAETECSAEVSPTFPRDRSKGYRQISDRTISPPSLLEMSHEQQGKTRRASPSPSSSAPPGNRQSDRSAIPSSRIGRCWTTAACRSVFAGASAAQSPRSCQEGSFAVLTTRARPTLRPGGRQSRRRAAPGMIVELDLVSPEFSRRHFATIRREADNPGVVVYNAGYLGTKVANRGWHVGPHLGRLDVLDSPLLRRDVDAAHERRIGAAPSWRRPTAARRTAMRSAGGRWRTETPGPGTESAATPERSRKSPHAGTRQQKSRDARHRPER